MGRAEPVSKKRKRPDTASDAGDASLALSNANSADKGNKKDSLPKLSFAKPARKKSDPGKYVCLDCEFVGIYDPANEHAEHSLARVSLVDLEGTVVLDTFVAQREKIGDWRTAVSGVRPGDVQNAPTYTEVQQQVADLLKDRILVGHAVHNDLKVLLLKHPGDKIRDTSRYGPLREIAGTKRPALRTLAKKVLDLDIQQGEHSSVIDAQATMAIYRHVQRQWESSLKAGTSSSGQRRQKLAEGAFAKVDAADDITAAEASRKPKIRPGKPRLYGGPLGSGRHNSLSLAATIAKQKDWWSSGTIS